MTRSRSGARATVVVTAAVLAGCAQLLSNDDRDDDEELAASLQCMSVFQGAEYQNLVAQFEAQEAQEAALTDEERGNPPQLFLGETTQSCYLDQSQCRDAGNELCRIVAESRIFGLPLDTGTGGAIDPSAAAAAAVGATAAAGVAIGVAITVLGNNDNRSSTTSTTTP